MAAVATVCPIQKRNIHLIISALKPCISVRISALSSTPSCLVMSRLVRSSSCSRKASSKLSAIARALGGSMLAASKIPSIFVVLTNG